MEEINHFSHEKHSLKIIENWEMIVEDNDEKKSVVCCDGCREPISLLVGGFTYGCISCRYFLHKTCSELPPTLIHHTHPLHTLTLIVRKSDGWNCDVCDRRRLLRGFSYNCLECDFDVCIKCGVDAMAQKVVAASLKKETSIKFEHEGHPQHSLTLKLRPGTIFCDACKTEEKDLFYECDSCDFWIHKTCASLSHTIDIAHHPNHPLVLIYSLPENCHNFPYYCDFCQRRIMQNDWLYHCANCRYFAHIKCALNAEQPSLPSDGGKVTVEDIEKNLLHFPMSYAFTNPLELLHLGNVILDDETNEINHWSHPDHPLILNVKEPHNMMPEINSSDLIDVCYMCVRPLSFPYYSCCEDGCSFTLHKYCAQLPRTLKHQLHPDHSLDLVDMSLDNDLYKCRGCSSYCNTFLYKCETCKFCLCVSCAFLPNMIKHKSHNNHPLIQLSNNIIPCKACHKLYHGISYSCKSCNFQLDMHCAMRSPHFLAHRYCKGHEIPLTYPPVDNHPEDFYCEICEMEMHPKRLLYHCHGCKSSFHLQCLNRIDYYANVVYKHKVTVSYHKHPLTCVRRQKRTPHYVCSNCNRDINGYLIFECRNKLCNYNRSICYECNLRKLSE